MKSISFPVVTSSQVETSKIAPLRSFREGGCANMCQLCKPHGKRGLIKSFRGVRRSDGLQGTCPRRLVGTPYRGVRGYRFLRTGKKCFRKRTICEVQIPKMEKMATMHPLFPHVMPRHLDKDYRTMKCASTGLDFSYSEILVVKHGKNLLHTYDLVIK